MSERNHWTQWYDDEGDVRECGPLTWNRADKLARETNGWIVSFDDYGKQFTAANYSGLREWRDRLIKDAERAISQSLFNGVTKELDDTRQIEWALWKKPQTAT